MNNMRNSKKGNWVVALLLLQKVFVGSKGKFIIVNVQKDKKEKLFRIKTLTSTLTIMVMMNV